MMVMNTIQTCPDIDVCAIAADCGGFLALLSLLGVSQFPRFDQFLGLQELRLVRRRRRRRRRLQIIRRRSINQH